MMKIQYKHITRIIVCTVILLSLPFGTRANDDFIEWHSTNIQLLKGWDYKLGEEGRTLVTLEHANKWLYGDFFMFVDTTRFDSGKSNIYSEFSPRFSLSKITGYDLSNSIIKDVLLSTTLEKGKNRSRSYLIGGAVDFKVPNFTFLKTNLYYRDNPNLVDDTWQVTLAWKYPLQIGSTKWILEGFADFAGDEGPTYKQNEHIVPRVLFDAGDFLYQKAGKFFIGIEWEYWHNKVGREGVTESNPQLQMKWVF